MVSTDLYSPPLDLTSCLGLQLCQLPMPSAPKTPTPVSLEPYHMTTSSAQGLLQADRWYRCEGEEGAGNEETESLRAQVRHRCLKLAIILTILFITARPQSTTAASSLPARSRTPFNADHDDGSDSNRYSVHSAAVSSHAERRNSLAR